MSLQLHGYKKEAWHMGRPLFRCEQEWCDGRVFQEKVSSHEEKEMFNDLVTSPSAQDQATPAREAVAVVASKSVCCLWLRGACREQGSHVLRDQELLHEDVRGLSCSFGMRCYYNHYMSRGPLPPEVPEPPPPPGSLHATPMETELHTSDAASTFVCCLWLGGRCREEGSHAKGSKTFLHEDVAGMMCGFELHCRHKHYARPGMSKAAGARIEKEESEPECHAENKPSEDPFTATSVCCLWLCGRCSEADSHTHGRRRFLHEDVPGMLCGFGSSCRFKHYERQEASDQAVPEMTPATAAGEPSSSDHRLQWRPKLPTNQQNEAAFTSIDGKQSVDSQMIPESSSEEGPPEAEKASTPRGETSGQVDEESGPPTPTFICCKWLCGTCKEVSSHMSGSRQYLHEDAPGLQCGYGLKCRYGHHQEQRAVCCYWLEDRCDFPATHKVGKRTFLHRRDPQLLCSYGTSCRFRHNDPKQKAGNLHVLEPDSVGRPEIRGDMLVCTKTEKSIRYGEVQEVSAESARKQAPVHVRFLMDDGSHSLERVSVTQLLVPEYSAFEIGMQVQVACGSKLFLATVREVSQDVRQSRRPICVHRKGSAQEEEEWVGADRLRSRALKFLPLRCSESQSKEVREVRELREVPEPEVRPPAASPLPWDEPGSSDGEDTLHCLDNAVHATECAMTVAGQSKEWLPELERALREAARSSQLESLLALHGWERGERGERGEEGKFGSPPDLQCLLDRLIQVRSDKYEVGSDSSQCQGSAASGAEVSEVMLNEVASSCAFCPDSLETQLSRQEGMTVNCKP